MDILKFVLIIFLIYLFVPFLFGMKEGFFADYADFDLSPEAKLKDRIDDQEVYTNLGNDEEIDPSFKGTRRGLEARPYVMDPPFLT